MVTNPIDPLATLTSARWALEGASDYWALVLQISTIAIGLGVFIEVVATTCEIIEDRRAGRKLPFHAIMTLAGGALVALALVFEFFAEFKSASTETALRKNNAAAQGELDKRAREATAEAVSIAGRFGGLQSLVTQKEGEMDAEVSNLKTFAQNQRARVNTAISALSGEEAKVQTARSDAQSSAGKAAGAADVANKAAISMVETLNSEKQMQAQMRAVVTRRLLTDAQFDELKEKLKPFAKTPFDLFVTDDADATKLVGRMGELLEKAGWDWKAAPTLGSLSWSIEGKPSIGILTFQGLSIEIAESGKPTLEKPVLALQKGLLADGLNVTANATPDEKLNPKFDKTVVHIFIGTR